VNERRKREQEREAGTDPAGCDCQHHRANALDISEYGMSINTQSDFLVGAALESKFSVNDTVINLKAVVQHCHRRIGIGEKFPNLIPERRPFIKKFVEREDTSAARRAGKEILLVDDIVHLWTICMNKLNLQDFSVVDTSNGVEALKQLQETIPALVVFDLWTEGVNGFKILQLMQLNPNFKDIPVIVLSMQSVSADIQKAFVLGARAYLPKMITTPLKLSEKAKATMSGMGNSC